MERLDFRTCLWTTVIPAAVMLYLESYLSNVKSFCVFVLIFPILLRLDQTHTPFGKCFLGCVPALQEHAILLFFMEATCIYTSFCFFALLLLNTAVVAPCVVLRHEGYLLGSPEMCIV